jgi:choline-glycine betaine transporter
MNQIFSKFSRRTVALFWCVLVGALIGVLLYLEQIALLYILATLTLTILLLIVAFANLEDVGRDKAEGFAGNSKNV